MAVPLLNPYSISFIDEMFYRLPFPDLQHLERLQEQHKVTGDVQTFLADVRADLEDPRAFDDLRKGWVSYLRTETKSGGKSNTVKEQQKNRRDRNRTPTQEEIEAMVCLLSAVHQHCEVHIMMSCSFQEQEEAAARTASQCPAAAAERTPSRSSS